MIKKIIVCDDDKGILELLEIALSDDEKQIISVSNSLTLFQDIEAEQPDVLLLDLWMPVLAGDQILKQLRRNKKYERLPVIVMSASRDGREIAINAGADDYIAKPFDLNELSALVGKYM